MTNVQNVVAGKPLAAGGVWHAPLGTAVPTNETTALNVAFKSFGYIGEDGVTKTIERSTEKVRAWGGDTVKVIQSEFGLTFGLTLIESTNSEVLKALFGSANVTTTAAGVSTGAKHAVKITNEQSAHEAYIFEVKDGDARIRIVVPDGQITEVGEVSYTDSDVLGYEVTIEAFYDATLGAQAAMYIDDGQPTG